MTGEHPTPGERRRQYLLNLFTVFAPVLLVLFIGVVAFLVLLIVGGPWPAMVGVFAATALLAVWTTSRVLKGQASRNALGFSGTPKHSLGEEIAKGSTIPDVDAPFKIDEDTEDPETPWWRRLRRRISRGGH